MRAMVYRGPYRIRVEEKPRPAIEHPNDAIVRVTRAAICGSDLHLYHGMMPDTRVGMTFGHEFIGVVDEVGPSVRTRQPGDRVIVPFNIFCGTCFFCARGLYANCHNVNPNATAVGGIYGYSHTCGGYDGGQAEYVRVPFADVGPSPIPDWMDDDDAVLLTDAVATGYFGAQLGDIGESDVVVVFGAGPVGLSAAKSSWLMGAGRVIVIDHLEYRLAKARTFAHAETHNFTEHADVVVLLKRLTDRVGADVATMNQLLSEEDPRAGTPRIAIHAVHAHPTGVLPSLRPRADSCPAGDAARHTQPGQRSLPVLQIEYREAMDDERVLESCWSLRTCSPIWTCSRLRQGTSVPADNDLTVAAVGTLTDAMETARDQLTGGKRHLNEAEMKQRRVTPGHPGHEIWHSQPAPRHGPRSDDGHTSGRFGGSLNSPP